MVIIYHQAIRVLICPLHNQIFFRMVRQNESTLPGRKHKGHLGILIANTDYATKHHYLSILKTKANIYKPTRHYFRSVYVKETNSFEYMLHCSIAKFLKKI